MFVVYKYISFLKKQILLYFCNVSVALKFWFCSVSFLFARIDRPPLCTKHIETLLLYIFFLNINYNVE